MATPKKRSLGPIGGGFRSKLVKAAREALQDPKVQAQILKHGGSMIESAKRLGPSIVDGVADVGGRFGQSGLERRATNVRAFVDEVTSGSPTAAAAMQPVTDTLAEVDQMLKLAAKLPFAKRKRAHMRIDNVLDELEAGLLDAITPAPKSDPTT